MYLYLLLCLIGYLWLKKIAAKDYIVTLICRSLVLYVLKGRAHLKARKKDVKIASFIKIVKCETNFILSILQPKEILQLITFGKKLSKSKQQLTEIASKFQKILIPRLLKQPKGISQTTKTDISLKNTLKSSMARCLNVFCCKGGYSLKRLQNQPNKNTQQILQFWLITVTGIYLKLQYHPYNE